MVAAPAEANGTINPKTSSFCTGSDGVWQTSVPGVVISYRAKVYVTQPSIKLHHRPSEHHTATPSKQRRHDSRCDGLHDYSKHERITECRARVNHGRGQNCNQLFATLTYNVPYMFLETHSFLELNRLIATRFKTTTWFTAASAELESQSQHCTDMLVATDDSTASRDPTMVCSWRVPCCVVMLLKSTLSSPFSSRSQTHRPSVLLSSVLMSSDVIRHSRTSVMRGVGI